MQQLFNSGLYAVIYKSKGETVILFKIIELI